MSYKFNRQYFTEEKITDYINQQNSTIVLSITSLKTGRLSMGPVWMVFHEGKFYFPGQRGTLKSKLIENGEVAAGVTIVDPAYFPQVKTGEIPYVTIVGDAKVFYPGEYSGYPKILELYFTKYNFDNLSKSDIQSISDRIGKESLTSCLIEITPKKNFILEALEKEEAEKQAMQKGLGEKEETENQTS